MNTETIRIRVTFIEPLLGSACGDPSVHEKFIASRASKDAGPRKADAVQAATEEVAALMPSTPEALEAQIEAKSTIFPHDAKGLFLWDYVIRGFVKEALRAFIDLGEVTDLNPWTYKGCVDSRLFVFPRRLYLHGPDNAVITEPAGRLQRSLRASTLQGDRIALANSEMLPEGTWFDCELRLLLPQGAPKRKTAVLTMDTVKSCLDYGKLKGIGQWRGASWGRLTYRELP